VTGAYELRRTAEAKEKPGIPWRDQTRLMGRILPMLWPKGEPGIKLRVIGSAVLVLATKIVAVAMPVIYKEVVDALSSGANAALAVPLALILGYGIARLSSSAATELRDYFFAKVEQRALRDVSVSVLKHVHSLPLRFHLERQTGGLSRSIERGTDSVEFLLSYLLFSILPMFLEMALVGGVVWHYFNFGFALVTVGIIVTYIVYTASATQWRLRFRREMNAQDREANARAVDSLLNYETVKYFVNEKHELDRFDEAKRDYMTAAIDNQRALSSFNVGQSLILSVGVVIVMVLAAYGVVDKHLTIGEFVMVNAYLLQLYQPLNMLGWVYRNLRQSMTDIEQMYKLLEEKSEIVDLPGAPALVRGPGHIRFDHVGFSYDSRRPILKDVSFEIPAGHTVAIVGPTGGGKTTIARILFRFYDPQNGTISIDGKDIKSVTQDSVRQAIGVVPQDTVLFNDSIYYNIAYGRLDATPEEVMAAARRAQLGDFIAKLPDGYLTRVGERGLKLSGGEKQRVAIARVILKRPEILIFDEATSSLDSRTEQDIQAALRQVAAHHTTLIIAHRLSTVVDADEIIVLDDGRITERGSHEALLGRGGTYAEMWNRQLRATETLADVAE
jgi:ATP-binding cassette subfamily B protein